jgi:hypothetical protein
MYKAASTKKVVDKTSCTLANARNWFLGAANTWNKLLLLIVVNTNQ